MLIVVTRIRNERRKFVLEFTHLSGMDGSLLSTIFFFKRKIFRDTNLFLNTLIGIYLTMKKMKFD